MKTPRTILCLALLFLAAALAAAGEPDWFTRVKEKGLAEACRVEVERHERGALEPSLHVGECYYELDRFEDGIAVFEKLTRSPDGNYAASALARVGEGLYHVGKIEEARATFTRCREENPDAWLDGSVAERCRAWLEKIDGKLVSPEPPVARDKSDADLEAVKKEIMELTEKLAELKRLLKKLAEEDK